MAHNVFERRPKTRRNWPDLLQLITIATPNNSRLRDQRMACPYFMPVAKLENGNWPHPARLPLGVGWSGHCAAPGHEGETPAQDVLQDFCNLGYASGCGWAPAERLWDAVRFAVSAPQGRNRAEDVADGSPRVLLLANGITGPSHMAIWNLTCREQPGCSGTTTRGSRRWRSVFWNRI
jgi:hypothetical protein